MPEELLPCPFCGGPATGPEPADSTWWIECERCEFTIERNSKVWTIDTWNKREVNTQQGKVEPPVVTRAREILEECGIVDVQGTPADQLRPLVELIESRNTCDAILTRSGASTGVRFLGSKCEGKFLCYWVGK